MGASLLPAAAKAAADPATAPSTSPTASWTPDSLLGHPEQRIHIYDIARRYCETNFDSDADLVGAQSKHPPNKKSHSTRESCYFAYGLLLTGDPADRSRANAILKKVVATQDTTSDGLTKGAFGWYAEEPPKDLNSAAFVGLTLADVADLDRRKPCLDDDVRAMVEKAGKLAVLAVMHRDVDPGYTNIAVLSTALAAAGEKLWHVPVAAAWSEAKLDAMMALADDSEYAEYLSPTYTGVAINGAYMIRKFAFSDAFAAKADATINHLWKQVAAAYHAPTYQLGGPFCRAYGDNMLKYAADLKYPLYLALDGAYPLPDTDTDHDWDKAGPFTIVDLPIGPRAEFKTPTTPWREWDAIGSGQTPVRHLSQYRDGDFILGTVAFQDEWRQKRNLVAYWKNPGPPPEGVNVGFCNDQTNEAMPMGYAGEKVNWYSQQKKDSALVVLLVRHALPPSSGCLLVFDPSAKISDAKPGEPLRIEDGTITTYLYPVTSGDGTFALVTDPKLLDARVSKVMRPWSTADAIGSMHAISYLAVFRPANQPAPVVSGLALSGDDTLGTATAKVDGVDLSVVFEKENPAPRTK